MGLIRGLLHKVFRVNNGFLSAVGFTGPQESSRGAGSVPQMKCCCCSRWITPDSLREMANPLRPTGNCFSIGLIDGTLRLHASGPSLILPGLESCSLLNESIILDSTFERERICPERSARASYRPYARRPQDRDVSMNVSSSIRLASFCFLFL